MIILRQKRFSEITEEDRKKLKKYDKASKIAAVGMGGSAAGSMIYAGIKGSTPSAKIILPAVGLSSSVMAANIIGWKKIYKKYHPNESNPTWKEVNDWCVKNMK